MANHNEDQIIEGHDYDGIQELDNPLPKWWQFIFYATVIFAFVYGPYYWFFGGPTLEQELEVKMAAISQQKKAVEDRAPEPDSMNAASLLKDEKAMAIGKQGYIQMCASCHGQSGEGVIGPNLTDKYWLHSKGDFKGVLVALQEGFPAKGMPPWKDVIPKNQHAPIAAYVVSLQGTNPPNGKEPQGEAVE